MVFYLALITRGPSGSTHYRVHSPYDLHPLVQRFLTLWRYAQLVSDCLAFLLSMLCCQCGTMMPLSPSSSMDGEHEDYQIVTEPMIDAGRASGEPFRPQHLVVDFNPQAGDSEEVSRKCQQFWEVVNNHPDLEGMMVVPEDDGVRRAALEESSGSIPVHRASPPPDHVSNYPAIHIIRTLERRGTIDTALASSTKPKANQ